MMASSVAPEIMKGGGVSYLGPPVDMWSLGAVAYEMLHNKPAFVAESMEELRMRVRKLMMMPIHPSLSADAHAFVRALLVVEPVMRATGDALIHRHLKWLGAGEAPVSPRRPVLGTPGE